MLIAHRAIAAEPACVHAAGTVRGTMNAHSREEVLALVRAHLADELDVDPAAIVEATRFREDLEADSLDLYTLVQELEDTYGIRMSDEQAAEILTVGQAVDFVMAHDGAGDALT